MSSDELNLILVDNSLSADDNVDVVLAKTAIYNSLSQLIPVYSSVSEGGVSFAWNLDAIKLYYGILCTSLNLENKISVPENEIRDRSNMW